MDYQRARHRQSRLRPVPPPISVIFWHRIQEAGKSLKKARYRVLFITIVPSPYQRDLFGALAAREDLDLSVCYVEAASPDSPWPEKPLRWFERILPGFSLPLGNVRAHVNWGLPDLSTPDVIVLSTFTSATGQWLMRHALRGKRWLFWGERLRCHSGVKGIIQHHLAAPISRASGIVGIGRAAEADYERRFPNVPHFCVPYHCELSSFLSIPRSREVSSVVTFLFCGQMIQRKGIDLLLLAFDRLIASGCDARLLLVGREADLPKYLEIVSAAARSRVCYEGFQPPERLAEYFARSDVFVLPSRHDGWGVVVNQALAAGLPIITSNAVGAGLDLVEDGINGMCVSADDVEGLYRAMEVLISNPDLAPRWGQKSRERAFDLTPEAGAEKWVRVFDNFVRWPLEIENNHPAPGAVS
jgi:glycosyltransferase involved in cell wall biosynthesis